MTEREWRLFVLGVWVILECWLWYQIGRSDGVADAYAEVLGMLQDRGQLQPVRRPRRSEAVPVAGTD
jgi:hypothetical protein